MFSGMLHYKDISRHITVHMDVLTDSEFVSRTSLTCTKTSRDHTSQTKLVAHGRPHFLIKAEHCHNAGRCSIDMLLDGSLGRLVIVQHIAYSSIMRIAAYCAWLQNISS